MPNKAENDKCGKMKMMIMHFLSYDQHLSEQTVLLLLYKPFRCEIEATALWFASLQCNLVQCRSNRIEQGIVLKEKRTIINRTNVCST